MPLNERLIVAAMPLVRAFKSDEDIRRAIRVDQAIDHDGTPNLKGRNFLPLQSPDGSAWRIRVSNTGAITATKVT